MLLKACFRVVCLVDTIKIQNKSDDTPDLDPEWRWHKCSHAQGRLCAKQDQAQADPPGQEHNRTASGATTSGQRTKQEGESSPTLMRRGVTGACSRRITQRHRRDTSPTLHLHAARGIPAKGSSRVKEKRDETSRGSQNGDTVGRKRGDQYRLGLIGSRTRPEGVIP